MKRIVSLKHLAFVSKSSQLLISDTVSFIEEYLLQCETDGNLFPILKLLLILPDVYRHMLHTNF